ncbi:MAG TPA: PIN domain-containing protein [Candidatus Hydrogenedentes bacterium]|nr:PIN domain-containing protein [Candidatus Hydrogenedentota bacterium]HNT87473.1 PIN domain-containing protein [Candidatus Hydrogenedentota bacterium]
MFLGDVGVVELTPDIRYAAIKIRRRESVKLPDAIIAATAQVLGAELLTNDQRLLRLSSLESRSVALRSE